MPLEAGMGIVLSFNLMGQLELDIAGINITSRQIMTVKEYSG